MPRPTPGSVREKALNNLKKEARRQDAYASKAARTERNVLTSYDDAKKEIVGAFATNYGPKTKDAMMYARTMNANDDYRKKQKSKNGK